MASGCGRTGGGMTPWAIHPVEFVLLLVAAFLSGVAVMCLVAANDLKRDE